MNYIVRLALICFVFMFAVAGLFYPRSADAIPVFARKYQTACQTCHWAAFPALNPFGKAFKDNGYRFPDDDEVYVKESPVAFGGEGWKRMFPKSIWPSTITSVPPIALQIESNFLVNPKNDKGKTAFDGIGALELLMGGTLGESFSWFGAAPLFENEGSAKGSETHVERLYIVYSPTLFEKKGLANIEFGRFEPRATPRSQHLSIIDTTRYLFSTWSTVPASNFTTFFPYQNGVEFFGGLNGPKGNGGLTWAAGVVNGERSGDAYDPDDLGGSIPEGESAFDMNNSKDYYARVSYKIGGMGVLGGGTVKESQKATENWQEKSLTLSSFFYRGNAGFFNNPTADGDERTVSWNSSGNHFWRYGTEADIYWGNFNLFGAATYFRDNTASDVTIDDQSGRDFDADLYTAELRWVALPWIIPAVRLENMNPAYSVGDINSFNTYSADVTVLFRANVKFTIGAAFADGNAPPGIDDEIYQMGVKIGL